MSALLCLAIALHDVDGPIRCVDRTEIRLQGIGALELDGRRRPGQPGVAGDPYAQRRAMAAAIGAEIGRDEPGERGQLWFRRPVPLTCEVTGHSYRRTTAWCRTAAGEDLSCKAIRIRVAVRWPIFDRHRRLVRCRP